MRSGIEQENDWKDCKQRRVGNENIYIYIRWQIVGEQGEKNYDDVAPKSNRLLLGAMSLSFLVFKFFSLTVRSSFVEFGFGLSPRLSRDLP